MKKRRPPAPVVVKPVVKSVSITEKVEMPSSTVLKYKLGSGGMGTPPHTWPAGTIVINDNWTAGKTPPYELGPGSDADDGSHIWNYGLDKNISVSGSAFWCSGTTVNLDLYGHTVTYNNSTPITVPNGDCETDTWIGWQFYEGGVLQAGPHPFTRVAQQHMFGSSMLSTGTNITQEVIIYSPVITAPIGNRQYCASAWIKANNDSTTSKIEILRASDGTVLATSPSGSACIPFRGFMTFVDWLCTAPIAVILRITITPVSADTIWLDEIRFDYMLDVGISFSDSWPGGFPYTSGDVAATGTWNQRVVARNLNIVDSSVSGRATSSQGGAFVQGQGRGRYCWGVWAMLWGVGETLSVVGTRFYNNGIDSGNIGIYGDSGGVIFRNNYAEYADTSRCSRRMGIWIGDSVSGGVRCGHMGGYHADIRAVATGGVTIDNNAVVRCQFSALSVGGYGSSSLKTLSNNYASMAAQVADAYGIALSDVWNAEIYGNTIVPYVTNGSGRGIYISVYDQSRLYKAIKIYSNNITIRERFNLEYRSDSESGGIQAVGCRVRIYVASPSYPNALQDIDIYSNTFDVRTGGNAGEDTRAYGVRLYVQSTAVWPTMNLLIHNNAITTIAETVSNEACALAFDGVGASASAVQVYSNTLTSNHVSFEVGSYGDGYQLATNNTRLLSNVSAKSALGATMTYRSVYYGSNGSWPVGLMLLDHTHGGGLTDVTWDGSGWPAGTTGSYYWGWVLTVNGSTPGETIIVKDAAANTLFTGTADASGDLTLVPGPTLKKTYPKGGPESSTVPTPLTVFYGAASQAVTPTENTTVTF